MSNEHDTKDEVFLANIDGRLQWVTNSQDPHGWAAETLKALKKPTLSIVR